MTGVALLTEGRLLDVVMALVERWDLNKLDVVCWFLVVEAPEFGSVGASSSNLTLPLVLK